MFEFLLRRMPSRALLNGDPEMPMSFDGYEVVRAERVTWQQLIAPETVASNEAFFAPQGELRAIIGCACRGLYHNLVDYRLLAMPAEIIVRFSRREDAHAFELMIELMPDQASRTQAGALIDPVSIWQFVVDGFFPERFITADREIRSLAEMVRSRIQGDSGNRYFATSYYDEARETDLMSVDASVVRANEVAEEAERELAEWQEILDSAAKS